MNARSRVTEIKFKNGSSIETLDANISARSSRVERQLKQFYSYFPHLILLNLMGIKLKWHQRLFVRTKYLLDRRFRLQVKRDRQIADAMKQRVKEK